jgi:hypothetical protein
VSLLETEKLTTISTSHVSEATMKRLPEKAADLDSTNTPGWWPQFCRAEGWLFYLFGDQDTFNINYVDAPKDLLDVLMYVRNSGFMWCLFDCDGPIIDGLYEYEW